MFPFSVVCSEGDSSLTFLTHVQMPLTTAAAFPSWNTSADELKISLTRKLYILTMPNEYCLLMRYLRDPGTRYRRSGTEEEKSDSLNRS